MATQFNPIEASKVQRQILSSLEGRLAKVEDLAETGFVLMMRYGAAYQEGSTTLVGLEHATVYSDRPTKVIRNRAGDTAEALPMSEAKVIQIAALRKAIEDVNGMTF